MHETNRAATGPGAAAVPDPGPLPRRYVIIIGAMKSGTTTLFDLMARHPAIAPSLDKEPGFFAFDEVHARGFGWFDTLFDFDTSVHRYRLEASTDYTKAPFVEGVWERMAAVPNLEVKLIYIMRHPLRRIESHANHTQRKRREIGREISPRPDHSLDAGLSPVSLSISSYASQLDRFAAARQAGALHWLTLEELDADPGAALDAIWRFLGLEPLATPPQVTAQNASAHRTRLHPAWKKIAGNRRLVTTAKALVPAGARRRVKSLFRQNAEAEGRFTLSAAESAVLSGLLAPEMARLRDEYGVDTAGLWGL